MDTTSSGDPRVLMILNITLSLVFATVLVWGLEFVEIVAFTPVNVVSAAAILTGLTWVVINQ
ncbi:MAG: hypothetical protein J07HQX50_01252 [Haloquadratum sp. J07HQX50]|nr:MAG: hypothetical protein J07HQX50_01252 [Haloquadratum sp. J07HQX50]